MTLLFHQLHVLPFLMLSCNANRAHRQLFGKVTSSHHLTKFGSLHHVHHDIKNSMHINRHCTAFNSNISPSCLNEMRCSIQPINLNYYHHSTRKPSTITCQRCIYKNQILNTLASSNEDNVGNEEQQKGMEEAFASLETLTPEDFALNESTEHSSNLKYSRTDDTPAANSGKSTKEEVEHYLEMQQEMEGTVVQDTEANKNAEEWEDPLELLMEEIETEEQDEQIEDSEEYPWSSINPILRLRGPVATGYGRGGKKLGVPTANVSVYIICVYIVCIHMHLIITCTQNLRAYSCLHRSFNRH